MMLPRLMDIKNKTNTNHVYFEGFTDKEFAKDSLLKDSAGLFLDEFPVLSSGLLNKEIATLTSGTALFIHDGDYYVFDGTSLDKISGETTTAIGTVTAGQKRVVYFNEKYYILPDMKVLDPATDTLSAWSDPPGDLVDLCVHENRLWGIYDDVLCACALGDATDWSTFDGVETDAYSVDTGTKGDFTAIRKYGNHIEVFKESMMFELYGSIPSNFKLISITDEVGCIDKESIVEAEGALYFMSNNGYMAYSGSFPTEVSNGIDALTGVSSCKAAKTKDKIYVTDGVYVYTFNITKQKLQQGTAGAWMKQGASAVKALAEYGGKVYGVTATAITEYESASGDVSKSILMQTPYMDELTNYKKYTHRVILTLFAGTLTNLAVTVYYDNGASSESVYTQASVTEGYNELRIPFTVKRCRNYAIKITATVGQANGFKLLRLEREYLVGSKEG